jgi:hypothetical protein
VHQRTIDILEKIKTGDFTAMHAAVGGDRTVEQVAERWNSNFGPLKGFRVLGTTRGADGQIICLAELQAARGEEMLRFGWNNGHIETVDAGPGGRLTFVPVSATEFAPFDLRSESPAVRVRFEARDGTGAPALVVIDESGERAVPRATP